MRVKWIALGALAVLALGAALLLHKPAKTDALIYGRTKDSNTLDPAETESGEDAKVEENIYENLMSFKDGSAELEPRLATKLTPSDDGLTWTIDLRRGVVFHDDTPLNADAVVFTFERLLKDDHPYRPKSTPYASMYREMIAGVEARGDDVVVFRLHRASPLFLHYLATFGCGIVSPTAVKKRHGTAESFSQNPVGTGPYKLAVWQKDRRLVLERHEKYWGPKAGIKRAILVPIKDVQTGIQKLKQGEIHILDNISPRDVPAVERDPNCYVEKEMPTNTCYLAFNLKLAPYSDLNFRLAVAHAVNRKRLIENAYGGLATEAVSIVPRVLLEPDASLPRYEYDLEKAKKLWPHGGAVVLWQPQVVRQYMPDTEKIIVNLRDDLEKLGLTVTIEKFDWTVYLDKTKKEDHPLAILGWMADYADADNYLFPLLHGKSAGELNISFFDDPEFNRLIDESKWEMDPAKRRELFRKAQTIFLQQLPVIPLAHAEQLFAIRKEVAYDPHPLEYRLYNAKFK